MSKNNVSPSNVRQGRFLWIAENLRSDYLAALCKKISDGYYFSDPILSRIAEDLAPVYADAASNDPDYGRPRRCILLQCPR